MITDLKQLDLTKTYTTADYLQWQFKELLIRELIETYVFKDVILSAAVIN
ncbi:MAG: hypothetical protein R2822_06735 [Spirosomataceae bacterium]